VDSREAQVTVLPGKKYTPEDIVRIVKRLPDEYRSETLIMLVPQRIPESYVKSTVTDKIEDHLTSLNEQILSRSRLERIVLDLNLYTSQRAAGAMEDVVEQMRGDITVAVEGKESFRVKYVNRNPQTAQKVTERLASLFIEENLRDRENKVEDTSLFLDSQLEDAKRRLIDHEKKLEEYRRQYSGQLPSQAASNLQVIQSAEGQLQSLAEAADRARERRLLLERQVADLQVPEPVAAPPVTSSPELPSAGQSTAQQLEIAEGQLRLLQLHAKPDHPDVRTIQRKIRDLQSKLGVEANRPTETKVRDRPESPSDALRKRRIQDLTVQMADLDRELEEKKQREGNLREVIDQYQAKVEAVPTRESELVELTRDYSSLQNSYQGLLTKREDAKISANLEHRNIGEQFRVLDPARLPERPFSPDRPRILMMGVAGSLLFGLALVGFLEYRDSTLKTEEDVVRLFSLPVLALVPPMASSLERNARRRRTWMVVTLATVTVLLCSGAAMIVWRGHFWLWMR
jgi:polysaccharide chain length determinant protein (PEP-CTERM system associated)